MSTSDDDHEAIFEAQLAEAERHTQEVRQLRAKLEAVERFIARAKRFPGLLTAGHFADLLEHAMGRKFDEAKRRAMAVPELEQPPQLMQPAASEDVYETQPDWREERAEREAKAEERAGPIDWQDYPKPKVEERGGAEREDLVEIACWHCGDMLIVPRPRCSRCPDECDLSGCQEPGCAGSAGRSRE